MILFMERRNIAHNGQTIVDGLIKQFCRNEPRQAVQSRADVNVYSFSKLEKVLSAMCKHVSTGNHVPIYSIFATVGIVCGV